MENREKFQSFLEKKLKIDRKREEVLKKEVDGMELVFIRNAKLERKAMSIFKNFMKEAKQIDDLDLTININALFNEDIVDDLIEIIYDSCITLQNDKLHRELEIKNPVKVVEALFEVQEIYTLGMEVVPFLMGNIGEGETEKK